MRSFVALVVVGLLVVTGGVFAHADPNGQSDVRVVNYVHEVHYAFVLDPPQPPLGPPLAVGVPGTSAFLLGSTRPDGHAIETFAEYLGSGASFPTSTWKWIGLAISPVTLDHIECDPLTQHYEKQWSIELRVDRVPNVQGLGSLYITSPVFEHDNAVGATFTDTWPIKAPGGLGFGAVPADWVIVGYATVVHSYRQEPPPDGSNVCHR